ncbi:MAG: hypothetical protein R6X12_08960 [bacterium]
MARNRKKKNNRAPDPSALVAAADRWRPAPIGPRFEWLDHDRIAMETGPLAGRQFEVTTEIEADRAAVFLAEQDQRVGQCLIERKPPGRGVELWDIGVRPHLRRGGLCAVMTWVGFRELIAIQQQASFSIRMVTSVRPGEQTQVQNIGICVVGSRLGLTSDFNAEKLLGDNNLVGREIIPARDGFPPGLKVTIRKYPLVLIAVALDPDTHRPATSFRLYQQLEQDPGLMREWARDGLLVLSNGNYSLRAGGVDRFVNALALDPEEAVDFHRRIVPLP